VKIKILYVSSGLGAGGKERQLLETIKHINKDIFEIGVISFNKNHRYAEDVRMAADYFKILSKRPTRIEPLFTIWSCFNAFRPDIVHTWDSLSSFYVFLPVITKSVRFIDGSIRDSGVDKGWERHFKRFFLKKADLVISNSRAGLNTYRIAGEILYNAIDIKRFRPRRELNEFNITMVANFSAYKDHDTFFKAATVLVNDGTVDHVFLLGDGPKRHKYESMIQQTFPDILSRFHFEGSVRNVEDYLEKCQVGVLCSTTTYSEGLSNSVLEYMAAGLVPVVKNTGGSPEIVKDKVNGYLIENEQQIIDCIRQVKSDPSLKKRLTEQGKMTIEEKFNSRINIQNLENIYKKLADYE
jgi:glycosyltransferase involved in cell wall biosynthesis